MNGEESTGSFYEKELQKTNQKEFRIEKVLKRKGDNYMSNGKIMILRLIEGLIKRSLIKMSQYFPKPFNSHCGDSIKVKSDLSNYATKTYQKYFTR